MHSARLGTGSTYFIIQRLCKYMQTVDFSFRDECGVRKCLNTELRRHLDI